MVDKTLKIAFSPALSLQKKKFNKALSSARVFVERAFGVCKARWRCLLKQLDNRVRNVSNFIITCFTLHNFCQLREMIQVVYYTEISKNQVLKLWVTLLLLSFRGQKIKDITKTEHTRLFAITFSVSFFMTFLE